MQIQQSQRPALVIKNPNRYTVLFVRHEQWRNNRKTWSISQYGLWGNRPMCGGIWPERLKYPSDGYNPSLRKILLLWPWKGQIFKQKNKEEAWFMLPLCFLLLNSEWWIANFRNLKSQIHFTPAKRSKGFCSESIPIQLHTSYKCFWISLAKRSIFLHGYNRLILPQSQWY